MRKASGVSVKRPSQTLLPVRRQRASNKRLGARPLVKVFSETFGSKPLIAIKFKGRKRT